MVANVETGLAESKRACVGCFACASVCKFDAIEMRMDQEGFVRARAIDGSCKSCGACIRVCPQITGPGEGNARPRSYALKAGPELLAVSSSGGAFGLLAEWVLGSGGYVCGTVFDDDMNVVYTITKDRGVVSRMHGSKYVFSEMRSIYDDVRKALEEASVLFVGLPCQVAALKNVLGESERLYTVDLLCGGQPSKGVYRSYLSELSAEKPVSNLVFRSKEHSYGTLVVEYRDGTRKVSLGDRYYAAFNRHLIKNSACGDCRFAGTPKPGDLTIGDLWGAERYIRDIDAKEGVSVVLVNTDKGKGMFDAVSGSAPYVREVPLDFVKRFNRFAPKLPVHVARRRFYEMRGRGVGIARSLDYCLEGRFDVGISGMWRVDDYGGEASYYALFMFFRDHGYEPLMIESRAGFQGIPDEPQLMKARYTASSRARWYKDAADQGELGARVFNFVAGPGSIWDRRIIGPEVISCYTLDFAPSWRNKISVASIIGSDVYGESDEERARFSDLVRRLDRVLVGDDSTRAACEGMGIRAETVLDPVFLCDESHYDDLVGRSRARFPSDYAFVYMIHNSLDGYERVLERVGLGALLAGSSLMDYNYRGGLPLTNLYYVENWVKCIKESSFVLTDSFYVVAFALIFRKPFVVVHNEASSRGRVATLLSELGMEGRVFGSCAEALDSEVLGRAIDYDEVGRKLDELRQRSAEAVLGSLV